MGTPTWKRLGNVSVGRANLGLEMPVLVYRLAQACQKDVLVKHFGDDKAKELIRESGAAAGTEFYNNVLAEEGLHFDSFVAKLQAALRDLKIGILKVESADLSNFRLVFSVAEDVSCSGMDIYNETVCNYEEGFIASILKCFTGFDWNVVEVDCWATGDRVCRFSAVKK